MKFHLHILASSVLVFAAVVSLAHNRACGDETGAQTQQERESLMDGLPDFDPENAFWGIGMEPSLSAPIPV